MGDPTDPDVFMGPVAGKKQYDTVIRYIKAGLAEGARLVAGGPERPAGLDRGYFVRPTIFADVNNQHAHRPRGDLRTGSLHHSFQE